MERKLMQLDEIAVLKVIVTNRISRLTDTQDLAKAKILLANIEKNEVDGLAEVEEYKEVTGE